MYKLIGAPSTNIWDRVKNTVFAFVIIFFWVKCLVWFLTLLNSPWSQIQPQTEFFLSCIGAPLWEEAVFRWAPITVIKGYDKLLLPVVLASSIIFGLGHGFGFVSILLQGVMGFVFACTYLKTGNIVWSMLLHSAWNTYCFIYDY